VIKENLLADLSSIPRGVTEMLQKLEETLGEMYIQ